MAQRLACITFFFFLLQVITAQEQHITAPTSGSVLPAIKFSYTLPHKEKAHALWFEENGAVTGIRNDLPLFEGAVKKHHLEGSWKSWHANGQLLDSGRLENGVPHGTWYVWNAAGQLLAVRNYDAHLYEKIKNELRLNHPRFSNFMLTERYKKEGSAVLQLLKTASSFPEAVRFTESLLEEAVEQNRKAMHQYHPVFLECLHHGLYLTYFPNGTLQDSGYYKNGLKEGVWVHRTNDGSVLKGAYKTGLRQLEWKEYDSKGKLTAIIFYNQKGEASRKKTM
jgi:antitoxin component YwqK of YwqJK toxin-antitoxin module